MEEPRECRISIEEHWRKVLSYIPLRTKELSGVPKSIVLTEEELKQEMCDFVIFSSGYDPYMESKQTKQP